MDTLCQTGDRLATACRLTLLIGPVSPTCPRRPFRQSAYAKLCACTFARRPRKLPNGVQSFSFRYCRGAPFSFAQLRTADQWMRQLDASEAQALAALRLSTGVIRRRVAKDRVAYLSSLADQAAAHDLRDPKALYEALRRAFPSTRPSRRSALRPLPTLQLEDGTMARTQYERTAAWHSHFSAQEAGTPATDEVYVANFKSYATARRWHFDINALPTLPQVERIVHTLQRGKAAGADGITCELLRSDAVLTSRQLLPILAKSALRAREPVSFRGGDLILLAKRAASVLTCENYRSILISAVPAKIYHRCIREQLQPAFSQHRTPFQGGVLPGQGIEFVSLTAKTFFRMCNSASRKAALVFFDLKAAFYQVLRQLLVENVECDSELLALFARLQLPSTAIQELKDHLLRACELAKAGVTPHTRALISDMFRGSWFRLSGDSLLTVTHRGARPGDPAADILFAFTLTAFVRQAMELLKTEGLQADLPMPASRHEAIEYTGPVHLACPSWADDFFFPQTAAADYELVNRVCRCVSVLAGQATGLGMTVKYGTDKTAVLFPASILANGQLLEVDGKGQLGLFFHDPVAATQQFLPAVTAYRHLGGIITANGDPLPDLYFRFSNSMGVVRTLRRQLFGARRFDIKVRRTLLQALSISRYVHTASALILSTACQVRVWERQYVQIWRALVARTAVDSQEHSYNVLRIAGAASPPLSLAKARAAFVSKLFSAGPVALLALLYDHWCLHPKSSWLAQLVTDVDCVTLFVPSVREHLPSGQVVSSLLTAYASDPMWWSRQVLQAQKQFQQDLELWHNPSRPQPSASPTQEAECSFTCYVCSAAFPLRKHLHAHLARSHAIFSPTRHYAISLRCEACFKHFPCISSVQHHLKGSPNCLLRCAYMYRPLTIEEVHQLEAPEKIRQRAVRAGKWQQFHCLHRSTTVPVEMGPALPTAEDRADNHDDSEQGMLQALGRGFQPQAGHVVWVRDFVAGRSREPPRQSARAFWQQRPVSPA